MPGRACIDAAFCIVAMAYGMCMSAHLQSEVAGEKSSKAQFSAGVLVAWALSFMVNTAVVMVSRTVLITAAVMLIMSVLLHLRWRSIAVLIAGAAIV